MEAADLLKETELQEFSWCSTNTLCNQMEHLTWRRWYSNISANVLQILSVIRWRQLTRRGWYCKSLTGFLQIFYSVYQMEVDTVQEFSWCSTNSLCIRWRQLTCRSLADVLQITSVSDGVSWPEEACIAWEQLIFYKYSLYQMKAADLKEMVLQEFSWCSTVPRRLFIPALQ
jgi:hypothetical protein